MNTWFMTKVELQNSAGGLLIIFPKRDTETYEKKQNLTPLHIKSNSRQIIDLNGIVLKK